MSSPLRLEFVICQGFLGIQYVLTVSMIDVRLLRPVNAKCLALAIIVNSTIRRRK